MQSKQSCPLNTHGLDKHIQLVLGDVAQLVISLTTYASLTAEQGVASLISAWSHTFVESDHKIISMVILLSSAVSFKRVVVSFKRMYVHEELVNRLFKLGQEKSVVRWTDHPI